MRYILTFKTNYSEESEFDHPRGYSICKQLYKELSLSGFDVKPPDNYRDIAWSVDCLIKDKRIFFFVGYLGTKMTDWQLIICPDVGLIRRLLGYKDDDERLQIAKTIHKILAQDNRFSDLKWFSRYTDTPKDVWVKQPDEL